MSPYRLSARPPESKMQKSKVVQRRKWRYRIAELTIIVLTAWILVGVFHFTPMGFWTVLLPILVANLVTKSHYWYRVYYLKTEGRKHTLNRRALKIVNRHLQGYTHPQPIEPVPPKVPVIGSNSEQRADYKELQSHLERAKRTIPVRDFWPPGEVPRKKGEPPFIV